MSDDAFRELILGGVRSGKSRHAEQRARDSGLDVTVIATAVAGSDEEMRRRIAAHRANRPASWTVVEEPLRLARVLRRHAGEHRCLVVECLTIWLTNLLGSSRDGILGDERDALLATLPELPGRLILVANETGLGVHAGSALGRRYCDEAGVTHQRLGALCDRVTLTVAGLPWILKGTAP